MYTQCCIHVHLSSFNSVLRNMFSVDFIGVSLAWLLAGCLSVVAAAASESCLPISGHAAHARSRYP